MQITPCHISWPSLLSMTFNHYNVIWSNSWAFNSAECNLLHETINKCQVDLNTYHLISSMQSKNWSEIIQKVKGIQMGSFFLLFRYLLENYFSFSCCHDNWDIILKFLRVLKSQIVFLNYVVSRCLGRNTYFTTKHSHFTVLNLKKHTAC